LSIDMHDGEGRGVGDIDLHRQSSFAYARFDSPGTGLSDSEVSGAGIRAW